MNKVSIYKKIQSWLNNLPLIVLRQQIKIKSNHFFWLNSEYISIFINHCYESRHTCLNLREVSVELNGLLAECGEGKSEVNKFSTAKIQWKNHRNVWIHPYKFSSKLSVQRTVTPKPLGCKNISHPKCLFLLSPPKNILH